MFTLALLIGIYSYIIFALGLSGFLYKHIVVIATLLYALLIFLWQKKAISSLWQNILRGLHKKKRVKRRLKSDWISLQYIFFALLMMQVLVNLIGALGPDLGFDALWYHLVLPKIYLQNHRIVHVPGGLLYYSDMPKLIEMLYIGALSFQNEILAKISHYFFGILIVIALYKISRTYFDQFISVIVVTVFYANLIVDWQSITAYVDLGRTFFETMALFGFLIWFETKEKKWFLESAVMLGLALATKLIALGSVVVFLMLIIFTGIKKKQTVAQTGLLLFIYCFITLLIPLPWFIFSFVHTGNPFYPLFSSIYSLTFNRTLVLPIHFVSVAWTVFSRAQDPILPIYLIIFPLVVLYWKRFKQPIKVIAVYASFAFIVWYFTSQGGAVRYLLPYLPAFSLLVGATLHAMRDIKIYRFTIYLILFLTMISVMYRGIANAKYIPVIIGKESKAEFLKKNLNFSFGDFYDTDGFLSQTVKKDQIVLLYGFHNLYYVDFPFIHESWVKKGNIFHYVAVQDGELPKRFAYWDLVYINPFTHVRLYSFGGKQWIY